MEKETATCIIICVVWAQLGLCHLPTSGDFQVLDEFVTFLPRVARNVDGYRDYYGLFEKDGRRGVAGYL